jgi:competence ComEA-like helix-hairpin-helix protein
MKKNIRFYSILALALFSLMMVASTQQAAAAKSKKIDLNSASQAELEGLKGIGAATAKKIIAARPFKNIDDLKNVSGIGQATFDELKGQVTVKAAKAADTAETKTSAGTKAKKEIKESAQKDEGKLIDLNSADKAALEGLAGIGPVLAEKIIAARPFKSIEDLKEIKGINQGKLDALKGLVTLSQEDDEAAVNPKLKPGQTININRAGEDDLIGLLGIGPVKAKAIIAGRPYAKTADIMKVKGIKEKTFAKIKDYIVVR